MIRVLYEFVLKMKSRNIRGWQFIYKVNKLIVNIFYPILQMRNSKNGLDENSNIIISLTSFPARIDNVWLTIATLLNQTVKPKRIILWLAEEQFPDHKLPKRLTKMCQRGLEIKYCDDLKPHKKYYYTMLENPTSDVITVDDDILYPENLVENLENAHKKYLNTVICSWSVVKENRAGKENVISSEWKDGNYAEPHFLTLPIGCGGVLYPADCLDKEVFNKEKIKELAFFTDDLWLKCMAVKNNVKAYNYSEEQLIFFSNVSLQSKGLYQTNLGMNGGNNHSWKMLMDEYPEVKKLIQENM